MSKSDKATPALETIKQKLFASSPYDLGTDEDSAFGSGVLTTLEELVVSRAVNSHDALLEACKKSLEAFSILSEHYGEEIADAEIAMLKNAINQAEGGVA